MSELVRALLEIVAVILAVLIGRYYLPAYAGEKGKNLATKEDIAAITAEVERTRLTFERARHVSSRQFELELEVYRAMWDALVDVHRAAEGLRPVFDTIPDSKEAEQTRNRERLEALRVAFDRLISVAYKHRPFYPQNVYEAVREMIRAVRKESIQFTRGDPTRDTNYWDKAEENIAAIHVQSDAVGEAIRARLALLSSTE